MARDYQREYAMEPKSRRKKRANRKDVLTYTRANGYTKGIL